MALEQADAVSVRAELAGNREADDAGADNGDIDLGHTEIILRGSNEHQTVGRGARV
jgi:hypothetical protein